MYTLLIVFYVLVSVALIGLVLIQHGKGADAGAAFGSGASGTVFGSRGSANFLSRATAWLASVFFVVSLALAYLVHGRAETPHSVVDLAPPPVTVTLPAPAPTAPTAKTDEGAAAAPPAPAAKPDAVIATPTAKTDAPVVPAAATPAPGAKPAVAPASVPAPSK